MNDTLTGTQMLQLLDRQGIDYLTVGWHGCNGDGQALSNNQKLDELFKDLQGWYVSNDRLAKLSKQYHSELYLACFQKAGNLKEDGNWDALLYDEDMNEVWLKDLDHGGKVEYDK